MKKRIFISLVAIAFLLVGIRVGTTSAYFISEDKVTNNFQNGDIDIEVEEPDFEPPSEGWSGQKINKKVRIISELFFVELNFQKFYCLFRIFWGKYGVSGD